MTAPIGRAGSPSVSMALGVRDPRARRALQVALAERTRLDRTLTIDDRQRLAVAAAATPGTLADGASDAEVVTYVQGLVETLRAAGLLEED
jgi:hypothetical protein